MAFQFYLAKRSRLPAPTVLRTDLEDRNCLHCSHFGNGCTNPNSGFNFICPQFTQRAMTVQGWDIPALDLLGAGPLVKSNTIDLKEVDFALLTPEQYADFDMSALIEKVKEDFQTGLPRDLKVDTSSLPLAKNFIDFSTNPLFTNQDENPPWAKQVQIITNLMTEYCHNPKCSDVAYAQCIPVDHSIDQICERVTFLEHGKCPNPHCRATKIDQWTTYGAGRYNELMGIGGQRGSKTQTVNRGTKYFIHQFLKLPRPHKIFGIEEATSIEMTFTATQFAKAKENLYDPLVFSFNNSPWFKAYHELLDDIGRRNGEELYKILGHSTIYRANRYHIYPATPNPQNMRGSTRALTEIDELSHLYTKTKDAVRLNPGELRNVLRNSLLTLRMAHSDLVAQGRYDIPTPMMMNITSPRTFNDTGMTIYRESQKAKSRIYGFHYSIYEMNPMATKNAEVIEELKQIERENPEDFKRDYLAVPPNASNAFITNVGAIQSCIINGHVNAIKTRDKIHEGGRKSVKMLGATYTSVQGKKVDRTTPKVLTMDMGKNKNSYAITVAHNEIVREDGYETRIKIFDAIAEIIPRDGMDLAYTPIMEDIIYKLIDEYNVKMVFADRWNSLQTLQNIGAEFDILAEQYSLKYNDFLEFKRDMNEQGLGFPMAEGVKIKDLFEFSSEDYPMCFNGKPVAHFFFQCLTVEDIMNKTVDKGSGYTDDIFRSLVLAHWVLNNDELSDALSGAEQSAARPSFTGAVGSMGGGITLLGGGQIGNGNLTNGVAESGRGFAVAVGSNVGFGGTR